MAKKLYLIAVLTFICFSRLCIAMPPDFNEQKFVTILSISNKDTLERKLIPSLKDFFQNIPTDQLNTSTAIISTLLDTYNPDNKECYKLYMQSMTRGRKKDIEGAENLLIKAINSVSHNNPDHYLSYTFLSQLAVSQSERGNSIGAIYNYFKAKREAEILNDLHLETSLNINISDLYYKNNIYNQSLFYLDNAQNIITANHLNEQHLLTIIYYNKAENFFRMGKLDSLKVYNSKLQATTNISTRLFTYRKRTDYYVQLLSHNYALAIMQIKAMQADKQYKFSMLDNQRLADAFYMNGQTDSAKRIINILLNAPVEANNPEIKLHLYQKLAAIAEKGSDSKLAIDNYRQALSEAESYIAKYAQIGNASSQIKLEELENSYSQRDENYKKQQLIMMFILIVAALSFVMIFMFYRNVKQKRHYENLLHKAEKHELAFINSHEVRKHLSNILGIVDIIRQSDDPKETYAETETYLYYSAEQLDEAIHNIADKLND